MILVPVTVVLKQNNPAVADKEFPIIRRKSPGIAKIFFKIDIAIKYFVPP